MAGQTTLSLPSPSQQQVNDLNVRVAVLLRAIGETQDKVQQTLGAVLGYPLFCDQDAEATEEDGVCVSDHTAETLADEAAAHIRDLREQVRRLRQDNSYLRAKNALQK